MAIYAECDGCKRCTNLRAPKGWRTLVLDLGHPEHTRDHGSCDEICELLLCDECADLLGDFAKVRLALQSAVSREGGRSGE